MTNHAMLTIDIAGYWHSGTGRGSGSHLDAVVDTTHDGLPYLSGRHIKGLLRDAVLKAETWNQLDRFKGPKPGASLTDLLFGRRNQDPESRVPRDETTQGYLRIGDGVLPADLARWLADGNQRALRPYLNRELSSTAIDTGTGVARSRSLRGIQVTVPLRLEAEIGSMPQLHLDPDHALVSGHWPAILAHCLPLIRAVGAHRTRGLGRARLHLHTGEAE